MQIPKNMLIYYGWLNSFNSATHSWNNEKVAQELARYNLLVLGDGIQSSSHGDYSNTQTIIARIKVLNPNCKIFGYVTVNQTYANFKTKVDEWETLQVHGIFMDEAGYDYGTVATNGRSAFNEKVDYIHSKTYAKLCFANAWNPDHVLTRENDASYANTTWNPDNLETELTSDDWFLAESLAITSAGAYESATQWKSRVEKLATLNINVAGCSVISDVDGNGQDKFDFIYTAALMAGLQAVGSSDTGYGATNARSKLWTRPDVGSVVADTFYATVPYNSNVYMKYMMNAKLSLDFTSSSESSSITIY